MSTNSYEKSKKIALTTILVLAGVTVAEVLIALLGKGHLKFLSETDYTQYTVGAILMGLAMAGLSFYKAKEIVFEFMHMKYEIKGLYMSVLLPTLLLVWAIIAFLYEGNWWKDLRDRIQFKNESSIEYVEPERELLKDDTYVM